MRKIPIAKPFLGTEEAQAAYDTILSGWVTQGPKVAVFEDDFAKYVGAKYSVAVSSCTTALHLSLICAGIKPGDEVICPSMSFIATANAIRYSGAIPVFSEVREDFNLDPEDVINRITTKTKAILLVHQIGIPADIDVFKEICNKNNLMLIEDAACAIGSSYKGKKIGSHSDLVCFSFHPRKVITTGDGGMITTNNKAYYHRLKQLRQHGMSVSDADRHGAKKVIIEEYLELGYNYRMTDIQASIGIEQLKRLDNIITLRREIAIKYNVAFSKIKGVRINEDTVKGELNYQSYALWLDPNKWSRNEIMQRLLDVGVSSRRGIMLTHKEKAYSNFKCDLPQSEGLSDNSILLPLFVPMEQSDVDYVIEKVFSVLKY